MDSLLQILLIIAVVIFIGFWSTLAISLFTSMRWFKRLNRDISRGFKGTHNYGGRK